ncbi:MAG: ABC transporter ATP-binding protein [Actinomycetia bacterium]|nr:ABC transporter ATP-binding protein [Actinomycetes bacterium]
MTNGTEVPLLEIDGLRTEFRLRQGTLPAVDGVSLRLDEGETLAVVGESGSGKSSLALSVLRLHPEPPCVYAGGAIRLDGRDLLQASERELRRVRGGEIAMIFQDPMTSLNPVRTVGHQIAEAVRVHRSVGRAEAMRAAVDALGEVGIPSPDHRARDYPHQYSGGMRQRAMIAMALACRPRVLLADEPTTALDVTIQAQVMELLADLQNRHGTAVMLVTHDLGIVAQAADRVLVMYGGRAVETGSVDQVFDEALMPYTWSLMKSTPRMDAAEGDVLLPIGGVPPNLLDLPEGCSFHPRCPFAHDACRSAVPPLALRSPGRAAACVLDRDEVLRKQQAVMGQVEESA